MKTYRHDGRWLTLVQVDQFNSYSRTATQDEIEAAQPTASIVVDVAEPVVDSVKRGPGRPRKPKD